MLLALLCLFPCATVLGAVAQTKLEAAQKALDNADTAGALTQLDAAIQEMEGAGVISGADNDLARAYYLKANILIAKPGQMAKVEECLDNAVKAAPAYKPEQKSISDPRIRAIYTKVLAKHNVQGQEAVALAQQLYTQEKYCDARRVLEPFQNAYGNRKELGEQLLSLAQNKCVLTKETRASEDVLARVVSRNDKRCGVLPVFIKEGRADLNLAVQFTQDRLLQAVKSQLPNAQIVPISEGEIDAWKRRNNISSLNDLAVWPGMIKIGFSLGDLFSGKASTSDITMGGLPRRYEAALAEFMAKENLQQVLLVAVESVPSNAPGGDGANVDLLLNLYEAPSIKKPTVQQTWNGQTKSSAGEKLDKIGEYLKAEFRARR